MFAFLTWPQLVISSAWSSWPSVSTHSTWPVKRDSEIGKTTRFKFKQKKIKFTSVKYAYYTVYFINGLFFIYICGSSAQNEKEISVIILKLEFIFKDIIEEFFILLSFSFFCPFDRLYIFCRPYLLNFAINKLFHNKTNCWFKQICYSNRSA